MDKQFNTIVYNLTCGVVTRLWRNLRKVVGSDDMKKENVMKELFGDFKPGQNVEPTAEGQRLIKKNIKYILAIGIKV